MRTGEIIFPTKNSLQLKPKAIDRIWQSASKEFGGEGGHSRFCENCLVYRHQKPLYIYNIFLWFLLGLHTKTYPNWPICKTWQCGHPIISQMATCVKNFKIDPLVGHFKNAVNQVTICVNFPEGQIECWMIFGWPHCQVLHTDQSEYVIAGQLNTKYSKII